MSINRKICPAGLKNNPNRLLKAIDYICIHTTGNYTSTANAKSHANYQYGGSGGNKASWHYTVDSNEIWQSFEDKQECWHTGTTVGNSTSIGIEICVNDKATFKQACDKTAWLVSELMKKHKLPISRVVQHNKWSGKNCPAELRSGAWGINWTGFINLVQRYSNTTSNSTMMDAKKAIDVLVKQGVITSPDYWLSNHSKVQYLDKLLINMAKKLTIN